LDYLLRSVNSRPDVIVCISQEKAENVLASKEYDALVPAQAVSNLLETGEKSGIAAYVSSNDLLNLYTDKTSDIYLPVVAPSDESVSVSGIAVFSGDKIVDILSDEESFGLMFMKGKVKNGLLDLSSEKFGKIGAEIIKTKVKTKAVFENGKIVYKVKIKAELVLDEIENGIINSISEKDIFEINSLVSRKITENCKSAFYKCTENKSDCLRIGESLAAENYKAYQSVSDNWHEYLSNAELDISVNAVLKQVNENSRGGQ
ncbi:MAG: Ger(x)C family spore germination C-terminal domain-containing protein, partial [Clostridiales bacterium]|nr:Ger(x)C family spore germination C-terminal domain-containing protein [Clostridiales bacterium]